MATNATRSPVKSLKSLKNKRREVVYENEGCCQLPKMSSAWIKSVEEEELKTEAGGIQTT